MEEILEKKPVKKQTKTTTSQNKQRTPKQPTKQRVVNKNNKTANTRKANTKKQTPKTNTEVVKKKEQVKTTKNTIEEAKKEQTKEKTIPKEKFDGKNTKIVKIKLLVGAFILVLLTILIAFIHLGLVNIIKTNLAMKALSIKSIELEDNCLNVTLESTFTNNDKWCQIISENEEIDEKAWIKADKDKCVLEIKEDSKYIVLKDVKNNSKKVPISDYLNTIISLNLNKNKIILVQGETKEIKVDIKSIGNANKELEFIAEDNEILQIKETEITGLKAGNTNLIIKDNYKHELLIPVVVTDLVTLPQLNLNKKFLTANLYTQAEAHILDELLEDRVSEAGLKTRAGAVAAARFLTLEFKYKIPYFLENGRFQKTGFSDQIDGEGRYYHKGLYLSQDKYAEIKRASYKPVMWGGTLRERSNDRNMKNGLDCSGFVTWALYNGGYDPGDIGAGPKEKFITLPDLGTSQKITLNLLKSGKVKAGDLIGWNGHIGMIIGIDEENVYTADTVYYQKGLVATKYTYKGLINSKFSNIYDMSNYYKEDGNYTSMW